eukprot:3314909-Amphidinium_carterae.1
MDLAERFGDSLYMMTLDYSKAFDVLPQKIYIVVLDTLRRYRRLTTYYLKNLFDTCFTVTIPYYSDKGCVRRCKVSAPTLQQMVVMTYSLVKEGVAFTLPYLAALLT